MAGLDQLCEGEVIRLVLDLHESLVLNTPVDTGWARANWVPTIGIPYEGGKAPNQTPQGVALARAQQEQALAGILSYRIAEGVIWLSNNVPYIEFLNEGSSQQAPAGFVQTVIAKTIAFGEYGGPSEIVPRSSFTYRPGQ